MWDPSQNFYGNAEFSPRQFRFRPYEDNKGSVVAIAGDGYAMIGADTRLSVAFCIGTRKQNKLFKLSNRSVLGTTGCWSDAVALKRALEARVKMYEFEHGKQISTPALAQMLTIMLYYKRFFPYFVMNILAGLDNDGEGWVYAYDPIGHCEKSKYFAGGSAAPQLLPILDNQVGLKNMLNVKHVSISKRKAFDLLKDCFTSAAERDIYTGDNIIITTVTAKGIEEDSFSLRRD